MIKIRTCLKISEASYYLLCSGTPIPVLLCSYQHSVLFHPLWGKVHHGDPALLLRVLLVGHPQAGQHIRYPPGQPHQLSGENVVTEGVYQRQYLW